MMRDDDNSDDSIIVIIDSDDDNSVFSRCWLWDDNSASSGVRGQLCKVQLQIQGCKWLEAVVLCKLYSAAGCSGALHWFKLQEPGFYCNEVHINTFDGIC